MNAVLATQNNENFMEISIPSHTMRRNKANRPEKFYSVRAKFSLRQTPRITCCML
jgi:hypothetical protein